ncbi:MAG TPA: acetate--CoA ligase [Nitrospiria bacterium]|nr:acetate--CoA ligase [Nitrospiria bacterium]
MREEIESMMKEGRIYYPPEDLSRNAYIKSMDEYEKLYRESIDNPEGFWARQAEESLSWFKKWEKVLEYDFTRIGETEGPYLRFFQGGRLNISYNCLDRHLDTWRRNKAAIIWQGDGEEDGEKRTLTYQQLHSQVCRFANVLIKHGIKRGDVVTIYLPMIPELPVSMLACTRIGAIHSVVFSAFSADALRHRILDCNSKMVITSDIGFHGGRVVDLKNKTDKALSDGLKSIEKVIVYNRGNSKVDMKHGRDYWWHEEVNAPDITDRCNPAEMDSEDPLFILYTSGSTGKPKGVLHTTAGYLLHVNLSFRWIFDVKDKDIFWCTADIGWVTGHSYVVYGPLSNGATSLMYEGVLTHPRPDRLWKIVADHKVNIFYTAPTAIRALMRSGEEWPDKHDLSSIRILGTVGEPINPEAWIWYHRVIGKERCPVVDTWWQTETGGIMITPLAGAIPTKPGSASRPFFGVLPEILRNDGSAADVNEGGSLVITKPWPGMIRGVYGDKKNELIKKVYFSKFPGKYFTGDGCRIDKDGFYWLMGRIDDVINVSGHRLATAEIESALVSYEAVAEAAVVGFPHDVKGQGIYCFVTLKKGYDGLDSLKKTLIGHVRKEISPIATPDKIQFSDALPKTRSGKIMRRILRKIAEGEIEAIGDTTTLADPSVVESLIKGRE